MVSIARMILRHLGGITAHRNHRLTNAYTLSSSIFSATKRQVRGYRATHYLLTLLYLVAGKLRIPFHCK